MSVYHFTQKNFRHSCLPSFRRETLRQGRQADRSESIRGCKGERWTVRILIGQLANVICMAVAPRFLRRGTVTA